MEHYSPEDFDEKEIYSPEPEIEEVEDAATLLLSDQLMEDDDESEIYEMDEEEFEEEYEDDEIIPGTSQPKYSDEMDSFDFDEAETEGSAVDLVQENPFEPVYPAVSAGLLFDENSNNEQHSHSEKGMVLEAISLDNILPAGSRRRRNN